MAIIGDPSRSDGLLDTPTKKAAVGHWLRERQRTDLLPVLTAEVVEKLAAAPHLPSLLNQRENALRLVGERSGGPGDRTSLHFSNDQFSIGSATSSSIRAITEQLAGEQLLKVNMHDDRADVLLTFSGWLAYEEIRHGKSSGRNAFMAMPFSMPDLEQSWLPQVRAAVKETGFDLKRVDDEPRPGLIDVRMRLQIQQARFLLVELTHANSGAYWEAGFAEGLGKPVIYLCRKDEKAHFDVDHSLRIEWTEDTIADAISRLKATIRNALPDALAERET